MATQPMFPTLEYLRRISVVELRPHFSGDNLFMMVSDNAVDMCQREHGTCDLVVKDREHHAVRFCIRGAEVEDGRIDVYESIHNPIGSVINDAAYFARQNFASPKAVSQFTDDYGDGMQYNVRLGNIDFGSMTYTNDVLMFHFTEKVMGLPELKTLILSYGIQVALTKLQSVLCHRIVASQCYSSHRQSTDKSGKPISKAAPLAFRNNTSMLLIPYTRTMDDSNMTYTLVEPGDGNLIKCSLSYTLHSGQVEMVDRSGVTQYYTTTGPPDSNSTYLFAKANPIAVGVIENSPDCGQDTMILKTENRMFLCTNSGQKRLRIVSHSDSCENVAALATSDSERVSIQIFARASQSEYALLIVFIMYSAHQAGGCSSDVPAMAVPTCYLADGWSESTPLLAPSSEAAFEVITGLRGRHMVVRLAAENRVMGTQFIDILDAQKGLLMMVAEYRVAASKGEVTVKLPSGRSLFTITNLLQDAALSVKPAADNASSLFKYDDGFARRNCQIVVTFHQTKYSPCGQTTPGNILDVLEVENSQNKVIAEINRNEVSEQQSAAVRTSLSKTCTGEEIMCIMTLTLEKHLGSCSQEFAIPQIANYYGRILTE